jgi:hypothetical protein
MKTIIDEYLLDKNSTFIDSIVNYYYYYAIMSDFSDKIKRLREGHSQIFVLGFQNSPSEYPLNHAVAAKILPSNAHKIVVVNSENRHLEATKTLKILHHIFNLPLPAELK